MKYISLQNLYELEGLFDYIREEAECQGFKDEIEAEIWVHEYFYEDFPEFIDKLPYNLDDDIWVEFCPFQESEFDDDDYSGYAIYINFSEDAMRVIEDIFAEYFI